MSACPPEDELVRMVEGALGDVSLAAIESHVDTCSRCATVIAGLGALESAGTKPRVVGRYQLDRRIGGGGMGEVWAAWDPQLRRDIAVKLVKPERADDDRERERLKREARALARLGHPNVLAVYDVGETGDEVFIATELVVGDTLASRGGANSDWRALVKLYAQAARGLAAAHAAGLVHRDIKPANLLIGMDGRVRVADFGLAVRSATPSPVAPTELPGGDPQITQTGYIAGTPAYMAPEQRLGEPADARADQYALCVALVEGISGRRPPLDIGTDAMIAFIAERRTREPDLDRLCGVMARGLSVDRDDRWPDMDALAGALEACVAPSAATAEIVEQPRRRLPWKVLALAAVAAIGGVGGVLLVSRVAKRDAPIVVASVPDAAVPDALVPDAALVAIVEVDAAPAALPIDDGPTLTVAPKRPPPTTTGDTQQIVDLGLAAARRAINKRDGKACLAAVEALPQTVAAMTGYNIELHRAQCEMLLGRCEAGMKRMDKAFDDMGSPPNAEANAMLLCPVEGSYETRFKRLGAQGHNAKGAHCRQLVAPAKQLVGEATVSYEKAAVANILRHLATCIGEQGDCAEAEALWAFAKAANSDIPAAWNIKGCAMPAVAAPPPDPAAAMQAFVKKSQQIVQTLLDRDAKACRAWLATPATDIPQGMEPSFELYAGFCMMMLGDCAGGSARAQKGFGANAPPATSLEDNYCPIAGTLDERLRRIQAQLGAFVDRRVGSPRQAWCGYLLGPAKTAAAEAQRADQRALAAKNLQHLAWCVSHAGRCSDAADLVALSVATDANADPAPKLSAKCP